MSRLEELHKEIQEIDEEAKNKLALKKYKEKDHLTLLYLVTMGANIDEYVKVDESKFKEKYFKWRNASQDEQLLTLCKHFKYVESALEKATNDMKNLNFLISLLS